jgi:hypothetical protein
MVGAIVATKMVRRIILIAVVTDGLISTVLLALVAKHVLVHAKKTW